MYSRLKTMGRCFASSRGKSRKEDFVRMQNPFVARLLCIRLGSAVATIRSHVTHGLIPKDSL